jgi:hypothetical protein
VDRGHIEEVTVMLQKHSNPDPTINNSVDDLVKQGLVSLFDNLLTRGKLSALEALYVGAAIEEVDMLDLQQAIDNADNDHIRRMYENLLNGSRNHLRTYIKQIEERGNVYEALFLSQDEINAVIHPQSGRRRSRTLC